MAEVSGVLRDWLAANRDVLNARFRAARKRFPKMESSAVLDHVAELLPPMASGAGDPSELLHELFDLILLHAGRGLLTTGAPLSVLLSETFPTLRGQLIARPALLPASLSNAVEHLGVRGAEFARTLTAIAPRLNSPEQTLDAGTVLAWRLGEARLREKALTVASQIPNAATLFALGLDGWPECAAPLAVAALIGDAWHNPRERIRPRTLLELDDAKRDKILALLEKLSAPDAMPLANWGPCSMVGEFAGFGGSFLSPPRLLNAGERTSAHRFWLRSGLDNFRIDADVFGWVCKPDASVDFPLLEAPASLRVLKALGISAGADKKILFEDGTLKVRGDSVSFSELTGASSFNIWSNGFAATLRDSFRIRVYSSVRPAL